MPTSPPHALAAAAHPDPYPFYADLVARAPLSYDEEHRLWVAAGAAAVRAVLSHPHGRVRPPSEPAPAPIVGSPLGEIFRRLVRWRDDPPRQALKEALAADLDALDQPSLAARAAAIAHHLESAGAPDLAWLSAFILRLPVAVVASLLGASDHAISQLTDWLHDLVVALRPGADGRALERGNEAAAGLREAMRDLLARPNRGEPLLRRCAALVAGGQADADDLLANGVGLLIQSYEATAGLIGNTLIALSARPELRLRVADDAALLEAVLREVLRFDAPIQNTRRFLAHDAEIGGRQLRAGEAILVVLAAANRDPAANPDPARFDPSRREPQCFTFGAGGHACPGGRLALGIAAAGVRHVVASGLDLQRATVSYLPLSNARIPRFGATPELAHTAKGGTTA